MEEERKKQKTKRRERDQIKFIDLRFEMASCKMQDSGKEEGKTFHKLHVLVMNDALFLIVLFDYNVGSPFDCLALVNMN